MSMDMEVWSDKPFDLPTQLPNQLDWLSAPQSWTYEGDGWQILVMPSSAKANKAISERLSDASHVAYITLEPIGADSNAYDFLELVVRGLARAAGGLWVDANGNAFGPDEGDF